ncbi:MAG TPA: hypothetical protein VIV08_02295, partial [Acidimicrobiia bacterium]
MASSYPPIPSNRMLIDRDGSGLNTLFMGERIRLPDSDLVILNNESSDDLGVTTDVGGYLVAWPMLHDLKALYIGFAQTDPDDPIDVVVEASQDTTDGFNGFWFELFGLERVQEGSVKGWWGHTDAGDYRRYIRPISFPDVAMGLRAIRIGVVPSVPDTTSWRLVSVHVFGVPAFEQNPHRLEIWHPWLEQRVPGNHFDWGNAPHSSSAEKSFRVHNLSYARRANGITVSVDAL